METIDLRERKSILQKNLESAHVLNANLRRQNSMFETKNNDSAQKAGKNKKGQKKLAPSKQRELDKRQAEADLETLKKNVDPAKVNNFVTEYKEFQQGRRKAIPVLEASIPLVQTVRLYRHMQTVLKEKLVHEFIELKELMLKKVKPAHREEVFGTNYNKPTVESIRECIKRHWRLES